MYRSGKFYSLGVIITLLLIPLFGCNNPLEQSQESLTQTPPLVRSMIVSRQDNTQAHVYSGEVRGRFETGLAFRIPGKIIARHVDTGSIVKAGDVLMEIDPSDIRQAVDGSRAQLAAASSRFSLAKDQLNRFQALYEKDFMSKAELDRYQNAHDSAQALLKQAKAQYTQAKNQLTYCNLKTESKGVVLAVHGEVGQVVGAGQPIVILAKGNLLEIEIDIPENRTQEFVETSGFQVSFWALPNVLVQGKLRLLSPVADPITRTYKARITLIEPPPAVKLGMTASVAQSTDDHKNRLFIPISAVYQTGDTPTVWVIEKNRVKQTPVRLGDLGNTDQVQVLEGLNAEDRIVTAGVHKLRNGERVRMEEDAQ